jgi:4-amino-4-deoxy-L-arabinose transferase-like glycosyltransferase
VTWALLAATVLLGVTTRVVQLGALPPGLYHDEAVNGLDAWRVVGGERPIFFEANNGREPLFLYAMAAVMAFLGRTPIAVRLAAVVLGALTVPATFWMARAMFDERVGLWSAFWMAVAPWPINLSRIGLRAVSMPLIVALGLGAWWTGRRYRGGRHRIAWVSLGGALLGLGLYTYTAARLILPAIVLFVLYQSCKNVRQHRKLPDRIEWLCLIGFAAVVMAPLAAYAVANWSVFAERSAQVSVFNPAIGGDRPWALLAGNVFRAAGLFFVRGDRIPRHNVPFRPLYDPLAGVFFLVGALLCLGSVLRGRQKVVPTNGGTEGNGAYALALIWTGVMLAPTILAEDCPHFLRAVGVLPVAALYPALGLEWARGRLRAIHGMRLPPWVGNATVGFVLLVSGTWGLYDYFWRHGRDPGLAYAFEADQVREAVEINRFLGTGWQGVGASEPSGPSAGTPIPGRRVYLSPRMWEDRFSVNLLVGSPERLSILGRQPAPLPATDEVLVLAWPFEDLSQAQVVLPHPAEIAIWPGPMERGDLDAAPRLLYVAYRATRLDEPTPAVARFEEGIELLGWEAIPEGPDGTRLRLRWRATRPLAIDYTVFVHLVRPALPSGPAPEGGQTVAQDDGAPGMGHYATSLWRLGDEIVDEHVLDASYDPQRDQIVVGWYEWRSMQHLHITWGKNGESGADRYVLRSSTG